MRRDAEVGAGRSRDDPRCRRGRAGEALACRFLVHHGYAIIQTNFRSRYGEIDIIARRGAVIAFIEVKTRLNRRYGEPFEAVGLRKQKQIRRLAQMWLAANQGDCQLSACEFRFDVISVMMSGREDGANFPDRPPGPEARGRGAGGPGDESARDESFAGIEHMEDAFR
ncbi:MAG: YraN family protein [Thermoleophilia bacterium]